MKVEILGDGSTDMIKLIKKAGIQTDRLNLASKKNTEKLMTPAKN